MAQVTALVEQVLSGFGYDVRRNDPYAGGYVTRHYGRPRDRVHALQIEVARRLYMDESTLEKAPGFERLQIRLDTLLSELSLTSAALLRADKKKAAPCGTAKFREETSKK